MKKYLLYFLSFFICVSAVQGTLKKVRTIQYNQINLPVWSLLLDTKDTALLPKRFRTSRDELFGNITLVGLRDLNVSGSAQFSSSQFQEILKIVGGYGFRPEQVAIVDLRGEPHALINEYPVMWYAAHAWWTFSDPVATVVANEQSYLNSLSLGEQIFLNSIVKKDKKGNPALIDVYSDEVVSLKTEEKVVTDGGARYVRIPVTDHMRPEDKDVDMFLTFIKTLPSGMWLHFHCHGGHGRTSTFIVMYDILRNPELSLNAIIERQVKLGSVDLRHLSGPLKAYKRVDQADRFQFIQQFYKYVHAQDGYGKMSWTRWVTQQHGKSDDRHKESNLLRNTAAVTPAGA